MSRRHEAGLALRRSNPAGRGVIFSRPFGKRPPLPVNDEELLAGIGRGEIDAFARFYERHAKRAYMVAMHVLHNVELAEEVAQDVFVNLWHRPLSYTPSRGAPLPWLLGVARHRAIDRWRSEQCRPRCAPDSDRQLAMLIAPGDVEKHLIDRECCHDIRTRLQALPAPQRTAIALSYYGELTQTEVATRLDVPVGTVKSRVRLGLDRLRITA